MQATRTTQIQEAIDRAEKDFRTPDGKEMKEKCPYRFSSNMADAYWITAWSMYHSGKKPTDLKPSRGHTWKGNIPGYGPSILTVTDPDQRTGITII